MRTPSWWILATVAAALLVDRGDFSFLELIGVAAIATVVFVVVDSAAAEFARQWRKQRTEEKE